jgi:Xaa-Pro dipeptidase
MLFNRSRAQDILSREKLDGLIAHQPINQYYLSDYWGLFNSPGGYDGAYFSVFPRAENQAAALVIPALELRRLETTGGTWMPNVVSYSDVLENEFLDDGTPRGADYIGWKVAAEASPDLLQPLEKRWVDIVQRMGRQMSPNAFWALTRAIKTAGLEKARIAVDDARIADWLALCGLKHVECVYWPQLFNEIRLVKTAAELDIMKTAAVMNEQALFAATDALRIGATWNDIENIYMSDLARRGGRGIYLLCGLGELPAESVRLNEPIMFDALGRYKHYCADFGRCAVVGEPSEKHRRLHQGICLGWDVAQQYLKPGVKYSELSQAVGDAVRKAGFTEFRNPVVHSLGLEHTDDPKPFGVQPQIKFDQVLEKNMVVNVDMPHTEIGWGSVHIEDTVVITDDGFIKLSEANLDIRIIPARI